MMRFAQPLVLVAALVLPWIWWAATRRRPPIGRTDIAWRTSTAVLAILGAAGLAVSAGDSPMTVVVAVDRSASIPLRAQARALARLDAVQSRMRSGDRLGLVSFGADAAIEWRPLDARQQGPVRATVSNSSTDIGAALRLARAVLPQDGSRRILLMSDGRDNAGWAEREALHAAAAAIPIDVVPSVIEGPAPLTVTRLSAPPNAVLREPYLISAEVSGTPGTRGEVVLSRDDEVIGRAEVTVGADGTGSFVLTERRDDARSYVYRATVESDHSEVDAHSAGAVVVVEGQPAILYVRTSAPALQLPLARAGFRVIPIAPEDMPTTAQAFLPFAGVVLDDAPAERFTSTAMSALAEYVENSGGGLLVLGSARTLALSGYPTTPLERILPVDLRPRAGQRGVPVELILLFDKSGSMAEMVGGLSKIEVARQAVAQAVHLMPPSDAIGVLAFDSATEAVAPLALHRDEPVLRAALGKVRPGGSTSIAPAVETAFQWFESRGRPAVARRHVVLISDGRTSEDDAARLLSLARSGIAEVSAVAIGSDANRALLEDVARASGGRAYFPESLRELPRMVAREAVRSSGGGSVEERFVPRGVRHPVLSGVDTRTLPALNGYVVSAVKPSAVPILASHLDDPILCAWHAGLGRVAVFTAGLASSWSARLRSWPAANQMWTQTVRWLSRRETETALRLRITEAAGGPRIEMEGEGPGGSFLHVDTVTATVRQPTGELTDITLEPFAPGRYEASLPVAGPGPYVIALTARDGKTGIEHRVVRPLYWSADREIRIRGADLQFLSRLASLTGGRVLAEGESPFDARRASGYYDVSRWLVAAALAMFVLDIGRGRLTTRPSSYEASRGSRPECRQL
ncbi:MAG: VWA domain-containing protein [Vicinamibacterales bacterium]